MHRINRKKLFDVFKANTDALVYLKGGSVAHRYNTDFEYSFRQESNFWYLTGVAEPDFHLVLDLKDQSWHLVMPRRDAKYAVWMGHVHPPEYYEEQFKPDGVLFDDQLERILRRRKPDIVYCADEAQATTMRQWGLSANTQTLPEALAYCRSIKTEDEIECLRKASEVAGKAHRAAMKAAGKATYEYELKAAYEYITTSHGLQHQPYTGIFAGGKNSAILHYVNNDQPLPENGHILIDAGAEYKGYAADISRCFPKNGSFTETQAELYDIVLKAQMETISSARPGVKMEDLHLHAAQVILEGLKAAGYLKGDVKDMMKKNVFALFFPHGLGHFMGLDTHDVGGYKKGVEPIDRDGLRFLRARRTLEKGMVITLEPGLYMIPALLEPAFNDPKYKDFLNISKLRNVIDFGGIRIEDDLVITADGYENLTDVPKTRKDIEAFMAG
jgi:Xaa-Pro dipeptidase